MWAADMVRWLGKCLCLVAALAVTDAHLILVQGWAWSNMLQDRAPERGVAEALESTFSGAEPCPMCCAVQEERHEEQEEAPVPESDPTMKWIPTSASEEMALYPPATPYCKQMWTSGWMLCLRTDSPEIPPPQEVA